MGPERDGPDNEVLGEISTGVVGIIRDHTGRGPTQARTYVADNLISVVLKDTLL